MLTEAARPLDIKIVVVDPTSNCPAAQAGARQIQGGFNDVAAINQLAAAVDVVTIESEHINTDALERLESEGMSIAPAVESIQVTQDKLLEKEFLQAAKIPTAGFIKLASVADATRALGSFGGKMVIKLRIGGYDGKGNETISSQGDIDKAFSQLDETQLYVEAFVPFQKELAVMVACDVSGKMISYPVVETIQKDHICLQVIAPAQVSDSVQVEAQRLSLEVVKKLKGAGVFGVELFLTRDNKVLVNEIAPRVHNSGHYTIEGCATSQFTQHLRAISGMELGSTKMTARVVVMINILGDRNGPAKARGVEEAEKLPGVSVHLYGKAETRTGRKMGHLTAVADTIEAAKQKAQKARSAISI